MSTTAKGEFAEFEAYDWAGDEEFQAGLNSILQSSPEDIDKESLRLQAQCFFWYKKTSQQISFEDYINYLESKNAGDTPQTTAEAKPQPTKDTPQAPAENPPYPRSFAEIVELIQSGKPIPGIKHIPNKLNEEKPSEPTREKRLKPWEVAAETQSVNSTE